MVFDIRWVISGLAKIRDRADLFGRHIVRCAPEEARAVIECRDLPRGRTIFRPIGGMTFRQPCRCHEIDAPVAEQRKHLFVWTLAHFHGVAEPFQNRVHHGARHRVEAERHLAKNDRRVHQSSPLAGFGSDCRQRTRVERTSGQSEPSPAAE
jgi:hypothetical protein